MSSDRLEKGRNQTSIRTLHPIASDCTKKSNQAAEKSCWKAAAGEFTSIVDDLSKPLKRKKMCSDRAYTSVIEELSLFTTFRYSEKVKCMRAFAASELEVSVEEDAQKTVSLRCSDQFWF